MVQDDGMMNESNQQILVMENGQDTRNIVGMLVISAVCHVALFLLVMFMPTSFSSSSYRLAPRSISVDLVSLPAGEPAPTPPAAEVKPVPVVKETPPPKAVSIPTPKPDPVPVAPKPKPKKVVKSLKKKTFKKSKVKKTVVQKPAPPAPKPGQKQVSKAIESMRQKVATQEKNRATQATGTSTGGGGGGGGGAAVLSRIQNYRLEAALAVAQNWALSQQMTGTQEQLVTLIKFRILPSGEIANIEIVEPSGNQYLDESAVRAIKKSSPVAPHPDGISRPYIEVGVRATPSGFR